MNGHRIAQMSHYNVVLGGRAGLCLTAYFDADGLIADYGAY